MVTIYRCDYCGKNYKLKADLTCGSVDLVRLDEIDLCSKCEKHIYDIIKNQIKERKEGWH